LVIKLLLEVFVENKSLHQDTYKKCWHLAKLEPMVRDCVIVV